MQNMGPLILGLHFEILAIVSIAAKFWMKLRGYLAGNRFQMDTKLSKKKKRFQQRKKNPSPY